MQGFQSLTIADSTTIRKTDHLVNQRKGYAFNDYLKRSQLAIIFYRLAFS